MTLPIAAQNKILSEARGAVCEEIKKRRKELLSDPEVAGLLPKNPARSRGWFSGREDNSWIDIIAGRATGPVGQALYEETLPQAIAEMEQKNGLTAIESLTLVAYNSALRSRQALQPEKEPGGNTEEDHYEDVLTRFRRRAAERNARGEEFYLTER